MVDVEGLAISALDDRLGYIDRLKTYTTKRDNCIKTEKPGKKSI